MSAMPYSQLRIHSYRKPDFRGNAGRVGKLQSVYEDKSIATLDVCILGRKGLRKCLNACHAEQELTLGFYCCSSVWTAT